MTEEYERNLREMLERTKPMPSPPVEVQDPSKLGMWAPTRETNLQYFPEYIEALRNLVQDKEGIIMDIEDIFNQPPPKPLTRHEADHFRSRFNLWSLGMISDEAFLSTLRHYKLPIGVTLRRLLDGETPFAEEEE